MGQDTANRSESWQQQLNLAKILLRKYGTLHGFHIKQLECYPIACCPIALDGTSTVDGDKKLVTYEIKTKRKYFRKNGQVVERNKNSLLGLIVVPATKYEKNKEFAVTNLINWSKELLWGPETIVEVHIDGSKIRSSNNS